MSNQPELFDFIKPQTDLKLLKKFIREYVVLKDDNIFNIVSSSLKVEETREIDMAFLRSHLKDKTIEFKEDETYYDLVAIVDSDSYKIYNLWNDKGMSMSKDDIYSLNVPAVVKDNFYGEVERNGLKEAIDCFRIMQRPKYKRVACSTDLKQLEVIKDMVIDIADNRADFNYDDLKFIRETREKKQDPACFDGNCLEKNIINGKIALFGREVR
jgi:hypothetical protein